MNTHALLWEKSAGIRTSTGPLNAMNRWHEHCHHRAKLRLALQWIGAEFRAQEQATGRGEKAEDSDPKSKPKNQTPLTPQPTA